MKNFLLINCRSLVLNCMMLLILLIGIQNNHEKKAINFLTLRTIELPMGFILGSSLIGGSLFGNFIFSIAKFE